MTKRAPEDIDAELEVLDHFITYLMDKRNRLKQERKSEMANFYFENGEAYDRRKKPRLKDEVGKGRITRP